MYACENKECNWHNNKKAKQNAEFWSKTGRQVQMTVTYINVLDSRLYLSSGLSFTVFEKHVTEFQFWLSVVFGNECECSKHVTVCIYIVCVNFNFIQVTTLIICQRKNFKITLTRFKCSALCVDKPLLCWFYKRLATFAQYAVFHNVVTRLTKPWYSNIICPV